MPVLLSSDSPTCAVPALGQLLEVSRACRGSRFRQWWVLGPSSWFDEEWGLGVKVLLLGLRELELQVGRLSIGGIEGVCGALCGYSTWPGAKVVICGLQKQD